MPTYLMTDIARPSRLQFLETEGVLRKVGVPLILPELSAGILSHYRQHGHCVQQLPSPLHCFFRHLDLNTHLGNLRTSHGFPS